MRARCLVWLNEAGTRSNKSLLAITPVAALKEGLSNSRRRQSLAGSERLVWICRSPAVSRRRGLLDSGRGLHLIQSSRQLTEDSQIRNCYRSCWAILLHSVSRQFGQDFPEEKHVVVSLDSQPIRDEFTRDPLVL